MVVYGDSFVEARSTRLEDTFPVRLEAALRDRRAGPVEVVNAGVSGYGPDQILARLDSDLAGLQPDLVILALYAVRRPGRVTNLFRDHYDADLAAWPRSDSARYKRLLLAEVLAEAGRRAAARSVPLPLMAIPAGSDISPTDPHRIDGARFPEYRPQALTDAIEEIAAGARLPLVNLFGPFHERRDRVIFYPIDGHWNVAAQALAARLVAEGIAAFGSPP